MIKIVLDCFGGDHSPQANVEGALLALNQIEDLSLILAGDEERIRQELNGKAYDAGRLSIMHAPEIVDCNEKPTEVIRTKKDSSMMKSIRLLREDDSVAGMVSIGSSGALVAAATLRIGRLRGVIRPAFCPVLPTMDGGLVGICDTGASVDITPDYLQQYAIMGSLYLQKIFHIETPRVALLNVGVEPEKGDNLRKSAYPLLENTPGINFVGNMESRDLLSGKYNLIVCDGFAGNVLIKSTEGACLEMLKKLKKDIYSRFINRVGALLMSKMFKQEKEFMNYQNYGGSVLLGTTKVVVKGHGNSKARGVAKCIEQAYCMEQTSLGPEIEKVLGSTENE